MSNTITIKREAVHISTTTVEPPYFFTMMNEKIVCCILSDRKMLKALLIPGYEGIVTSDVYMSDDAQQCSEPYFNDAWEKAGRLAEENKQSACTSVKPAAPFLTEKAV